MVGEARSHKPGLKVKEKQKTNSGTYRVAGSGLGETEAYVLKSIMYINAFIFPFLNNFPQK